MANKSTHRIRNWRDYNQALVNRGRINFWFDEASITSWVNDVATGKRGRPQVYTDVAIECALIIRAVFSLPLRATEGLLQSLIELMDLSLPCPDYSTLCKRRKDLNVELPTYHADVDAGNLHVAIDSTGLKVFGEGEWKVRAHGYSKRRTWRKLHLAVDTKSHMILSSVVTTNDVHDSQIFSHLHEDIKSSVSEISADGAYDTHEINNQISACGATPLIPPRKRAKIVQHGNSRKPRLARDETIRSIRKFGRKGWKKASGYHKRSLSETAMFRIKTIFGDTLSSRNFDSQRVEALLLCSALNKMTKLGMPDSYLVASK